LLEAPEESDQRRGERLGKIVLRRKHPPDRRSNGTIAGLDLISRKRGPATHVVLSISVDVERETHRPNLPPRASFRKSELGSRQLAALVNFDLIAARSSKSGLTSVARSGPLPGCRAEE
jgi:hypothetical protein